MALMASACQSEWDDHYDRSGSAGGERLMTLIASDSCLSKFAQALQQTGTDTLLLSNQTYTVWAPTDQALAELDLTDLTAVRRLVSNHIARFSNPTSTTGRIQMLNGKTMQYSNTSTFNGVGIAEANIAAENGLLHKLSGQIPYKYNIRELMDTDERFSDVSAFVAQFDQQVYDERHSTTYDSVFVDYNPLLEDVKYGIGDIADEDSLFTMILPNNAAWQQAS